MFLWLINYLVPPMFGCDGGGAVHLIVSSISLRSFYILHIYLFRSIILLTSADSLVLNGSSSIRADATDFYYPGETSNACGGGAGGSVSNVQFIKYNII